MIIWHSSVNKNTVLECIITNLMTNGYIHDDCLLFSSLFITKYQHQKNKQTIYWKGIVHAEKPQFKLKTFSNLY